jgi:hypothetical protein
MCVKLEKHIVDHIREFLRHRPNLPHNVAAWALTRDGISVSAKTITRIRNDYDLKYIPNHSAKNIVHGARDRGTPITAEFLKARCPRICQEYHDYLLETYSGERQDKSIPPMHVRSPELMRLQLTGGNYAR